jgi:hypothetical protein
MMQVRRCLKYSLCFLAVLVSSGCDEEDLWGNGPGATASVSTPSGIQTGDVVLTYTLTGDMAATDVSVSFSRDGRVFEPAKEGTGGDGRKNLSVSSAGDVHTFVWASGDDVSGERESFVVLRISPEGGVSDTTSDFSVHNLRFLAALEDYSETGSPGRVRLYSLDAVEGRLRFLDAAGTKGLDPYDVIYDDGFFFVSNESSNDISVFVLDEVERELALVEGSPFGSGTAQARHLATDGRRLFVAGAGNTVSVLDRDSKTGGLTFNSSILVADCQALAVRSGHLYVASEATGEILILDIQADGELLPNGYSPITTGGLVSPRAMAVAGARIYAVNSTEPTICGFNVLGGGNLSPVAGSPFTASTVAAEQLAATATKLFVCSGDTAQMTTFTLDAFGDVSEDAASPVALAGPSFSVASAGSVVVTSTTSRKLETWTIDGTGLVSSSAFSPFDAGVGILRVAISE